MTYKEKKSIWNRNYNLTHKLERRDYDLQRRYGITLLEYNKMLQQQNDCCYICKRHKSKFKNALNVDHDHSTGRIRGLLCAGCNRGIGYLQDNISFLKNAIKYLTIK